MGYAVKNFRKNTGSGKVRVHVRKELTILINYYIY